MRYEATTVGRDCALSQESKSTALLLISRFSFVAESTESTGSNTSAHFAASNIAMESEESG